MKHVLHLCGRCNNKAHKYKEKAKKKQEDREIKTYYDRPTKSLNNPLRWSNSSFATSAPHKTTKKACG
jgi:hypothetical protein